MKISLFGQTRQNKFVFVFILRKLFCGSFKIWFLVYAWLCWAWMVLFFEPKSIFFFWFELKTKIFAVFMFYIFFSCLIYRKQEVTWNWKGNLIRSLTSHLIVKSWIKGKKSFFFQECLFEKVWLKLK